MTEQQAENTTNDAPTIAAAKKISLRCAVFIGIGSMVGAGIFALFGEAGKRPPLGAAGRGGRQGHLAGHERDHDPADGRRADRHMEYVRHHRHRGLLRHQIHQPGLVLLRRRPADRHHRHRHRQLMDDGRHAGRRLYRHCPGHRRVGGHRCRSGYLRGLLRRQDDPSLRDDHPDTADRGQQRL